MTSNFETGWSAILFFKKLSKLAKQSLHMLQTDKLSFLQGVIELVRLIISWPIAFYQYIFDVCSCCISNVISPSGCGSTQFAVRHCLPIWISKFNALISTIYQHLLQYKHSYIRWLSNCAICLRCAAYFQSSTYTSPSSPS